MDNKFTSYSKYAGLVFQMAAVIFLFTWIGLRLDEWFSLKQPYLTALFAVIGVIISVWQVIKGLIKPK